MTHEEKQVLLKDLCARLPYRVKYDTEYGPRIINDLFIYSNGPVYIEHAVGEYNQIYGVELHNIKPYLRPMSSMTEVERLELSRLTDDKFKFYLYTREPEIICYEKYNYLEGLKVLDWLNSHHFDYRGLISMGLALEAPEGMYKTE